MIIFSAFQLFDLSAYLYDVQTTKLASSIDIVSDFTEMSQPNNGKASVLCEATRLLKEFSSQIESLKKENVSLLSETQYVSRGPQAALQYQKFSYLYRL